MTGYQEINGKLHVDNVPLSTIAQTYGTPAYVYSADVIKSQYDALKNAMVKALPSDRQPMLCYACKANSNIGILAYLKSLGASLEIVSEGELHRGLKAGFEANEIVATGVGKTDNEIRECLKAGIHQFNIESQPELENINLIAKDMDMVATVVFRFNPNVSGGGHHKISTGRKRDKFGIGIDSIYEIYALAAEMENINPVGLSMHIGSQVFDVAVFETAFLKLPEVVHQLRENSHDVTRLDIGGGFPIIYKDEDLLDLDRYAEWVRDIIVPLNTEIIMEPGRYLVGNAGVILTKVAYVKETSERNFLVIDTAMNDLIRPTLYDAYHGIEAVKNRDAETITYDVVGPICETGDTFTTDRQLPKMSRGDLAVIQSAGAYGFCMASNYNTRPMPPEILVHDGKAHELTPRQTYSDLLDREKIPEFLK